MISQLTQISALTLVNKQTPRTKKKTAIICSVSFILLALSIFISRFIIITIICIILVSFTAGFLQGITMGIILDWGAETGSSKYSTINEITVGLGFGFAPLISGYLVDAGLIYLVFIVSISISVTILLILLNVPA